MQLEDLCAYAKKENCRIFFAVGMDRCMINPQGQLKVAVTGYVDDPTHLEKNEIDGQVRTIVDAALASVNARKNHAFDSKKVFEEAERFEFHYEERCSLVNVNRDGLRKMLNGDTTPSDHVWPRASG